MDDDGKQILDRILKLRKKQKGLLPLFMQSKKILTKHQKCLRTVMVENNQDIPF